ncbi:MAG: hypothetical protein RSE58_11790, partial [Clostridia bacterium]
CKNIWYVHILLDVLFGIHGISPLCDDALIIALTSGGSNTEVSKSRFGTVQMSGRGCVRMAQNPPNLSP